MLGKKRRGGLHKSLLSAVKRSACEGGSKEKGKTSHFAAFPKDLFEVHHYSGSLFYSPKRICMEATIFLSNYAPKIVFDFLEAITIQYIVLNCFKNILLIPFI